MGNRFEALKDGDQPVESRRKQRLNTDEEAETGWRRKGEQTRPPLESRSRTKEQRPDSHSGYEEGEGSRIEKEHRKGNDGRAARVSEQEMRIDSGLKGEDWVPQFSFGSKKTKNQKSGPAQYVKGGKKEA